METLVETKRERGKVTFCGSITVMMSMVLFLILSIVLVSLESTRQECLRALQAMNLQSAMSSVLGEYYAPLFEKYGLYGIYDVDIDEELKQYLEAASAPLKYTIDEVVVSDEVVLTDGGAALAEAQMIDSGAIDGVEAIAEELLGAAKLLEEASETDGIIAAKLKAEQELTGMDVLIVELMRVLDGAPVSTSGFVYDEDGNLVCEPHYVKRFVVGEINIESVKLNHEGIFAALSPWYVNVSGLLENMRAAITQGATDETIRVLEEGEITLELLVSTCKEATSKAVPILEDLISYQKDIQPYVEEFEDFLKLSKEVLPEETYKEYLKELEIMKDYVGLSESSRAYDFTTMKATIQQNEEVLDIFQENKVSYRKVTVSEYTAKLSILLDAAERYSFRGLELNYGEVKGGIIEDTDGLWDTICDFVLHGYDGYLFLDPDQLSERVLLDSELPSKLLQEEESTLFRMDELEADDLADTEFLESYLDTKELEGFGVFLSNTAENIADKALLLAYMNEHFNSYAEASKNTALSYEKEYLIFGGCKDISNVRKAGTSVLGLRVVLNLIFTMTDTALATEATALATSIFGSIGLPFLINACKYVLLFVCGVQNAILETMELLAGKSVPLLVTTTSFQNSIATMATMTKSRLTSLAKSYKGNKSFSVSYDTYLLLFMLLEENDTLTYRAMDLIQGNIRMEYASDFALNRCVVGYGVELRTEADALYTAITMNEGFSYSGQKLQWNLKGGASY